MRRALLVLFTTITMVLAGAGWAMAGAGGAICRGFGQGDDLRMRDHCFEGIGHVVTAGQTVTVKNAGQAPHTITAVDGSFDSGNVAPGESYELALDEAGTVPIYCTLHGSAEGEGMAGLLVVEAADLTDAEPTASSAAPVPWVWVGLALLVGLGGGAVARRRLPRGPQHDRG